VGSSSPRCFPGQEESAAQPSPAAQPHPVGGGGVASRACGHSRAFPKHTPCAPCGRTHICGAGALFAPRQFPVLQLDDEGELKRIQYNEVGAPPPAI
jgi:hypothetical protein